MAIMTKSAETPERSPRLETEHDRLVQVARRWLSGTAGCRFVLTEMRAASVYEQPDAIGWKGRGESLMIECKASRSDFLADKKKPHNRRKVRLGQRRFYLAPRDLIKPDELPERWGLLEQHGSRVRRIVDAETFQEFARDTEGEMCLLLAAAQGVSATVIRNAEEARRAQEGE